MDGTPPPDLYARDFHAWTQDQAARLRALGARNDGLDVANLAEEIESLGKSDRRAAESLLAQIILHLLKIATGPEPEPRAHWMAEVDAFRDRLGRILRDSPSLHARRHEMAAQEWEALRQRALRSRARGMLEDPVTARLAVLPVLPFDVDRELLDDAWFPAPPDA